MAARLEKRPAAQAPHEFEPDNENAPAAHTKQLSAPVLDWYAPDVQLTQLLPPAFPCELPAAQLAQALEVVLPDDIEYIPAGHAPQLDAPVPLEK